ncbi:Uncharacterised protein [Klebsiella pneumoniae]|nr:Uncharacterised protein [Klebsiella pneumoniae]
MIKRCFCMQNIDCDCTKSTKVECSTDTAGLIIFGNKCSAENGNKIGQTIKYFCLIDFLPVTFVIAVIGSAGNAVTHISFLFQCGN